MKNFPFPKRIDRQDSLHEKGVRKLRQMLTKEGFEVFRLPSCAGDLLATKEKTMLIAEVKKLSRGNINCHEIIQGVGQLLYYSYVLRHDERSNGCNIRLLLGIPYNKNDLKQYTGRQDALETLYARVKDFLDSYHVRFVPIELTDEEYMSEAVRAILQGRDPNAEFEAAKLEIIRKAGSQGR